MTKDFRQAFEEWRFEQAPYVLRAETAWQTVERAFYEGIQLGRASIHITEEMVSAAFAVIHPDLQALIDAAQAEYAKNMMKAEIKHLPPSKPRWEAPMTSNKGRLVWLPTGWKAVPFKATDKQLDSTSYKHSSATEGRQLLLDYDAMLSAAPELPPFEWSEERVEAALKATMPGGAPFWAFLPGQKYDDKPSERDFEYMRRALNAASGRG